MENRVAVLDCTIRDGGLGLQFECDDPKVKKLYSICDIVEMAKCLTEADIDIIELGTLAAMDSDMPEFGIFRTMESISELIPSNRGENQIFSVFFQSPDYDINSVPNYNPSLCELIRFSVRYSELDKSLDCCRKLVSKGYKVSIQPIVTVRYTKEEIEKIAEVANEINAYSVYIVDSYGSMSQKDVRDIYALLDLTLKADIRIGVHAHNNMETAFSNSLCVVQNSNERKVIVDSCCMGLGQGAGNLQTEVIVNWLNREMHGSYVFNKILQCCEIVSKVLEEKSCGYSLPYMIPARYNAAYKYGKVLRDKYHLKYEDIDYCLSILDDNIKYRYSEKNVKEIVERFVNENCRISN